MPRHALPLLVVAVLVTAAPARADCSIQNVGGMPHIVGECNQARYDQILSSNRGAMDGGAKILAGGAPGALKQLDARATGVVPPGGTPGGQPRGGPQDWGRFGPPNPPLAGPDGQPLPSDTPLTPELVEQLMSRVEADPEVDTWRGRSLPLTPEHQAKIRSILNGAIQPDTPGSRVATLRDAHLFSKGFLGRYIVAEQLYREQVEPLEKAGRPLPPELAQRMNRLRDGMDRMMVGELQNSDLHNEIMNQARDTLTKLKVMSPERWVGSEPRNPGAQTQYGNDLLGRGRPQDALAAANRALENGGGASALSLRAAANSQLGNYNDAVRDAQQALQMDPGNQQAMGALKLSEGRADIAPGAGVQGAPVSGPAMGGGSAGRGFAGADGLGGARSQFAGSNYSAGAAAAARFNDQARGALRMGDDASALDFAARALAQDPRNALAYFLRASALYRQGKYREAAEAAGKGLETDPRNAALLQVSARSLLKDKDYKGAAAAANLALERDPNAAWAFAARGYANAGLGDRAAALEDLKRAAEADPAYKDLHEKALRTPSDEDLALLFPGEAAEDAKGAMGASSRGRSFSLVTGAAAVGGLLLALGLLSVFAKPLSEGVSSVFTRMTRRSPAVSAPVAAAPPRAGLLQGKYELGKQIGQGGMGLVFDGTDRSLNRRVAVKRMRDEIRVDPRERARFVSEAKTVAALHHPNIVDIYAVVEEGEDLHLVFEYVEGRTLHDVLGSGRVAPADAAKVVRGAAAALDYAHSRGVIHRDMKPSNLMLDGRGGVKVMDFGIARVAKDVMTRGPMTNTIVGTPPYMAPEQEQGQVRKESDVYALAVCAYELLCGRLPFPGVGAGMLMNKINMSYVPPSKMAEHLPAALDEVFLKAFQPDPDKRFRASGEFAAALEAALSAPVKA